MPPQVVSLFDRAIYSSLLKLVRDLGLPQQPGHPAGAANTGDDEDDDMDGDNTRGCGAAGSRTAAQHKQILHKLAAFLQGFGFKDQPETLRFTVETVADVIRSPIVSGALSKMRAQIFTEAKPKHRDALPKQSQHEVLIRPALRQSKRFPFAACTQMWVGPRVRTTGIVLIADPQREACLEVLSALMQPIHGNVRETSALVYRQVWYQQTSGTYI